MRYLAGDSFPGLERYAGAKWREEMVKRGGHTYNGESNRIFGADPNR